MKVEAVLVMLDKPAYLNESQTATYWNMAWDLQADIRLDEFQDGSVTGTARGDLCHWASVDAGMRDFKAASSGRWDKHATFELQLAGTVDDEGYSLKPLELPTSLPNPGPEAGVIQFWDFLFPSKIEGRWTSDGSRIMEGQDIRIYGNDMKQTSQEPNFRNFSILYTWSIRSL